MIRSYLIMLLSAAPTAITGSNPQQIRSGKLVGKDRDLVNCWRLGQEFTSL
jgi:hypothetical protein